jgi:AcrR family transcriptional regulator
VTRGQPVPHGVPKQVDHDARRVEIAVAALRILEAEGPTGLTIRSLAQALGGSTALVTHYFPTRQAVVEGLVDVLLEAWQQEVAALRQQEGGSLEPRTFLLWMLPLTDWTRMCERARLRFHAANEGDRDIAQRLLRTIDMWMRAELARVLAPRVPDAAERDRLVDLLRATVGGLVLSSVEHPEAWPPERMVALVDDLLGRLGLLPPEA